METTRILLGLAVAIFLPDSLPMVRLSFLFRAVVAGGYSLWILAPILPLLHTLGLMAIAMFWSCSLLVWEKLAEEEIVNSNSSDTKQNSRLFGIRIYLRKIASRIRREVNVVIKWLNYRRKSSHHRSWISASILTGLSIVWLISASIGVNGTPGDISRSVISDKFTTVISGLLMATFVGHEVIARIYAHFDTSAPRIRSEIFSFDEAYGYIGWFERALVFAFVVCGQAEAAALAIAAKSLARHPRIDQNPKFGERFIVGTFASVLFSVFWAVVVRLALGFRPM